MADHVARTKSVGEIRTRSAGETRAESPAVEDYLKAVWSLEQDGARVTTGALAERLGVIASSVSGMVRRLAELDLVSHDPYRSVALTDTGRRVAVDVVRRHRLTELFLTRVLELPWDEVHGEAEVLEHALSPRLVERIATKLGDPTHDPHGDPIPRADGTVPDDRAVSLTTLEPGARGTVVRVSDSDPRILRYLSDHRVALGDRVEVVDRAPFDGPLTVRVRDAELALGGPLAAAIRVRVDPPA